MQRRELGTRPNLGMRKFTIVFTSKRTHLKLLEVSDHASNAEKSGIGRKTVQEVHLSDRDDRLVGVKIPSSKKTEIRQSTRSTTARFIKMLLASGAIRGLALR